MDTTRYHRIPIHLKPHVKKYLTSLYGTQIIISAESPVSMVLYAFLKKKTEYIIGNKEEIKKRMQHLTQVVYIYIPKRNFYRTGIFLQDKNQVLINSFFEQQITLTIYHLVTAYASIKRSQKAAIEYFCNLHQIEIYEDITMDALQKNLQRLTEKIKHTHTLNQIANDENLY